MKIELLVTTMKATDFSLVERMNIQTDAILCNQTTNTSLVEKSISGHRIRLLSTETIGKSINQNIGLFYTDADVVLFADDDVKFIDGYERIVQDFFSKNPDADAVKFYCESTNKERPLAYKRPSKISKARRASLMSAGTPCLAVKKAFLDANSLLFNISVGPGTKQGSGEDSLFYNALLGSQANVYLATDLIATVDQLSSSWFAEYNDDFFKNLGYVYKKLYGPFSLIFIVRRAIRLRKITSNDNGIIKMVELMYKGTKNINCK